MTEQKRIIGWREWVALPDLGIPEVKAKVDTGADNSSLHAFDLERFSREGESWVRFTVHPRQRHSKPAVLCEAPVVAEKKVKNPNGSTDLRPVIRTRLVVAGVELDALVNLAARDVMTFRMLLGRRAIRKRFLVDPGRSYLGGRPSREEEQ